MHFEEILDQAIAMLQRRGRVTYRALKRQFDLDDAFLEDFSKGFEHFPPLPPDFSRADMYTDHGEIPLRHAGPPHPTLSRLY